jgi:hypothetical protein
VLTVALIVTPWAALLSMSDGPEENECANCGNITFGAGTGRCSHCYENTDGSAYESCEWEIEQEAEHERKMNRRWAEVQARVRPLMCWKCRAQCHGPEATYCVACKIPMLDAHVYACDGCDKPFTCTIKFYCSQQQQSRWNKKLCDACLTPTLPCMTCKQPLNVELHRKCEYYGHGHAGKEVCSPCWTKRGFGIFWDKGDGI